MELKLNGRSLGRKRASKTCRTLFKVPYEAGELTAVSYNGYDQEMGTCTLTSASEHTELRLLPETNTVKADGLLFVRLRFTDENGIWKPLERHMLKAEAENGTLVGLCCTNSYIKGNYNQEKIDTYYGEALAIIRAGQDSEVTLTVTPEGGEPVKLSVPVEK